MTRRAARRGLWMLAPVLAWCAYTQAFPPHGVGGLIFQIVATAASCLWLEAMPSSLEPPPKPPKPRSGGYSARQPRTPITEPPPPPPGPGSVSRKGGYPRA